MNGLTFFDMLTMEDILIPDNVYLTNWQNMSMDYHMHPVAPLEINYVKSGEGSYFVDGVEYKLRKKNLLIVNGAIKHKLVFHGEPCLIIGMSCGLYKRKDGYIANSELLSATPSIKTLYQSFDNVLLINDAHNLAGMFELISKEFHNAKSSQHLHMLLNILLIEISRLVENDKQQIKSYVAEVIDYMVNNYFSIKNIDEMAEAVGLNKIYIQRVFKNYTGETMWNYLSNMRMERAIYFLSNPQIPIGQIDELIGFNSRQAFYMLFKKKFGISPKEYRDKILNGEFDGEVMKENLTIDGE